MTFRQPRFRSKVDLNQKEIVEALRKAGASVELLRHCSKGVPDLLVGYNDQTILMEVKRLGAKPKAHQDDWHKDWRGGLVVVVHTVDEALQALKFEWILTRK